MTPNDQPPRLPETAPPEKPPRLHRFCVVLNHVPVAGPPSIIGYWPISPETPQKALSQAYAALHHLANAFHVFATQDTPQDLTRNQPPTPPHAAGQAADLRLYRVQFFSGHPSTTTELVKTEKHWAPSAHAAVVKMAPTILSPSWTWSTDGPTVRCSLSQTFDGTPHHLSYFEAIEWKDQP